MSEEAKARLGEPDPVAWSSKECGITQPSRRLFLTLVTNLLWRYVEGDSPEVDLLIAVDARYDEEDSRTLGATCKPKRLRDFRKGFSTTMNEIVAYLFWGDRGGRSQPFRIRWRPWIEELEKHWSGLKFSKWGLYWHLNLVQSGCRTGNRKKLSSSQTQLGQTTNLAVA